MLIYYINLARRTERRAAMEAQFARLGLEAERFEAITPDKLTPEQIGRYCNPGAYRWKSPIEFCCSFSHQSVMRRFLETGAPHAMILEDDVILSASLPAFISAFETAAPAIDLLRIETDNSLVRQPGSPSGTLGDHRLMELFSHCGGSAGYIVSRRGAQRITGGDEILAITTDQALFGPGGRLVRELTVRQLSPALLMQEDRMGSPADRVGKSDLESGRHKRIAANREAYWRRTAYNAYDFLRRDIVLAARNQWLLWTRDVRKRPIPFQPD